MDKELLEEIRHQFVTLDGLYCSDLDDFSASWRLDLSKIIERIDSEIEKL